MPINLSDLPSERSRPLAHGFDVPSQRAGELMTGVFDWTSHPYLMQRLCRAVAERLHAGERDPHVGELVRSTFFAPGAEKDSNIEWVRDMLTERAPRRGESAVI